MFLCTKSTEILDGIRGSDNFSYLSLILAFGVLKSPGTLENFWSNERICFQWNNISRARQEMYDHQSWRRFLLWCPPCSFSMKKLSKLFQGQERHPRIKTLIPCSATALTSTGPETEIEIRRQRGLANTRPTRRRGAWRGPRGLRHVATITAATCLRCHRAYTCPGHRKSRGHVVIIVMTRTILWTTEKRVQYFYRYFCCLKVERKILMFILRHTLPNLVV